MAGNLGELVQMISALSEVQARKRQLKLGEDQLAQQAQQFASTERGQDFTQAIKLIAGSSQKTREGLNTLVDSLAPQYQDAARAFLHGQPIDPTVIHAQDIQQGHDAMSPGQLGVVQNESAVQNATGMNVGGLAGSQLQGALAAQAIPQVTPQLGAAYAERVASGRTPAQAAVENAQIGGGMIPAMAKIAGGLQQSAGQAAQTGLGYANLNFNYAQLDQNERKMAAEYGLDKMLKTAEAMKYASGGAGQLTGQAWLDGMQKLPQILNDINKNTSDKAGNIARIRLFNATNAALGSPVPMLPLEGEGAPTKVPVIDQMGRSLFGGPKVSDYLQGGGQSMPWPTMTPTDLGTRR